MHYKSMKGKLRSKMKGRDMGSKGGKGKAQRYASARGKRGSMKKRHVEAPSFKKHASKKTSLQQYNRKDKKRGEHKRGSTGKSHSRRQALGSRARVYGGQR